MNSKKSIRDCIIWGYGVLRASAEYLQPLILLLLRLHWGWLFFQAGKGKLLNHGRTVEFFASLGIPLPGLNAWFVGGVECIGGLLLLIGLFSRPVGLILSINMLVAYISVESDRAALLGIFSDPQSFIAAEPFFYLFVSLVVLAFGPGKISLDALLCRFFCSEKDRQESKNY